MRAWAWLAVFLLASMGAPGLAQGPGGPHGRILIVGDEAFTATGSGVVRGAGTPEDPYVIEGWTIDVRGQDGSPPGIHIRDTVKHVVVKDCLVLKDKAGKGIHVQGAKNVRIERCKVHIPAAHAQPTVTATASDTATPAPEPSDTATASSSPGENLTQTETATSTPSVDANVAGEGIHIEDSGQVAVVDSELVFEADPSGDGALLLLENTTDAALVGNEVVGSPGHGIRIVDGSNVTVEANDVSASGGSGIVVESTAPADVAIVANNVTGNQDDGIHVEGVAEVVVRGNEATGNEGDGIEVIGASTVAVEGNEASANGGDGIEVVAGAAVVAGNTVSGNDGVGVVVEGGGDGQPSTVANNTVEGNGGGGIVVEGRTTVSGNTLAGNKGYAVAVVGGDPETAVTGNNATGDGEETTILVPPGPRVEDNEGATVRVTEAGFDPREDGGDDAQPRGGGPKWLLVTLAVAAFGATVLFILRLRRR